MLQSHHTAFLEYGYVSHEEMETFKWKHPIIQKLQKKYSRYFLKLMKIHENSPALWSSFGMPVSDLNLPAKSGRKPYQAEALNLPLVSVCG